MSDHGGRAFIRAICQEPGLIDSMLPDPNDRAKLAQALLGGQIVGFKILGQGPQWIFTSPQARMDFMREVATGLPDRIAREVNDMLDTVGTNEEDSMFRPLTFTDPTSADEVSKMRWHILRDWGFVPCEACENPIDTEEDQYHVDEEGHSLCQECIDRMEAEYLAQQQEQAMSQPAPGDYGTPEWLNGLENPDEPEPEPDWAALTRRTNDPKLAWIEQRLTERGISFQRRGDSFHAPILEVPVDTSNGPSERCSTRSTTCRTTTPSSGLSAPRPTSRATGPVGSREDHASTAAGQATKG